MEAENAKVLVADDDRMVRRIVVTKLSGLGYEVGEAADGQEVLERLESGEIPDLLIVDNFMPRVNGIQLVRKLRGDPDPRRSTLPMIMLTARSGEQDVIEGLETGLDDYVTKPFSPDELAARVRTALRRASRG